MQVALRPLTLRAAFYDVPDVGPHARFHTHYASHNAKSCSNKTRSK